MELRDRVAFRFERQAEAIVNPTSKSQEIAGHLPEFAQWEDDAKAILDLITRIREIKARDPESTDQKPFWDAIYAKDRAFQRMLQLISIYFYAWFRDSWELGLAILQQYSLQAPVRRKIEQMVKFWVNRQTPKRFRLKGPPIDQTYAAVEMYLEQLKILREQQEAVLAAITHGKPMSEADDMKVKAGPFTLVNTGGFNEAAMNGAAEVVEKAAKLLSAKGFGRLCYGDIHITKKIGRGNVLAFYMKDSDEFFVRAGVRLNVDSLHTVLHEFGHRLHRKFLASKNGLLAQLYAKYNIRKILHRDREELDESQIPPIGEEVVYKGDKYRVVNFDRYKRVVRLDQVDDPRRFLKAPLETYKAVFKGEAPPKVNPLGFVTPYAGKSPEENFAEMFAFYCTDELSPEQVEDFKPIVS